MANENIRIPNLPNGKLVDEQGNASDDELTFRQGLITSLQQNFGPEGCVVPTQTAADIAIIVANQLPNGQYTCRPGTLLYDSTNDLLKAVILVAGVPTLKTVTLV